MSEPSKMYTGEALTQLLPHRKPMLLLDSVKRVETENGCFAEGSYAVRGDEFFLQGHFPDNPVVPGVIQLEILAQSACVLMAGQAGETGALPLYTGLDKVRFHSPVKPGDVFRTRCEITRSKHPFYFAKGEGYVGDRLCVKAEFSFAYAQPKGTNDPS